MINATLIIKPVIDKSAFHRVCDSVTGKNYLRDTDEKNLRDPASEVVSILNSYGHPYDSSVLVPVGFIFAGTVDLLSQIPSIVQGNYLSNQESSSSMIGSLIVIAPLSEWLESINRPVGDHHLEACFENIRQQIQKLTYNPGVPRIGRRA